jgi:hypothetical protein
MVLSFQLESYGISNGEHREKNFNVFYRCGTVIIYYICLVIKTNQLWKTQHQEKETSHPRESPVITG